MENLATDFENYLIEKGFYENDGTTPNSAIKYHIRTSAVEVDLTATENNTTVENEIIVVDENICEMGNTAIAVPMYPNLGSTTQYSVNPSGLNSEYDIFGLLTPINNTLTAEKYLELQAKIIQIKKVHNHTIGYTEKSGWYTYVTDKTMPKGLRKIRIKSQQNFITTLYSWYYDGHYMEETLTSVYEKWIDWYSTPNNNATVERIKHEWNAYYHNEILSQDIINKSMCKITSLELREWIESLMRIYAPNKRKFYRMFFIVKHCFLFASDEDRLIVETDMWEKASKKINRGLITRDFTPTDASQVFTDGERMWMRNAIYEDMITYKKQPTSAGLQILFLFETGLRIGECCGLKWSDIDMNTKRLYIRRQADNKKVKEWAKTTSGLRNIPLTREALGILEDVKMYNQKHRLNDEWIFQGDNPDYNYRLSYNAARQKLLKLCDRMNTERKSPHKCRKTCISTLLDCPDINARTVQRFAGHSDINTTMKFYSFERKSLEQQADAIDRALSLDK